MKEKTFSGAVLQSEYSIFQDVTILEPRLYKRIKIRT